MQTYSTLTPMVMIVKKAFLLALLSICLFISASAQDTGKVIERGLNTSGIIGQTDLSDSRLSGLVQPFVRYELSSRMEGEFSIGLGILKSRDYQTRLIPINYNIHFYPFEKSQSIEESIFHWSELFLYTGFGALNYAHVRIPRPDDPLTVNAGRTIPNSTFWSFGNNWTWQLPIGVGYQLQLDPKVNVNLKAGYTFTGSREIEALSGSNHDGYWSVSIGLSFRGKEKARQTDQTRRPVTHTMSTGEEMGETSSEESSEAYAIFELYFKMKSLPVIIYQEEAGK